MIADELQYTVDEWNARGGFERVLSRSALVTIARGAFDAAVREYPARFITLRDGARVIAEYPERKR
jgi:hypothetical protein